MAHHDSMLAKDGLTVAVLAEGDEVLVADFGEFTTAVFACAGKAVVNSNFEPSQIVLLQGVLEHLNASLRPTDLGQPLALLHMGMRAGCRSVAAQARHVATACLFYIAALDLFDDVQDDDLAGTAFESAGPAIAINTALALIFLAFDSLQQGMALESDPQRRSRFLTAFNRSSLTAVGCQHGDLLGEAAAQRPEEVMALHRGKTCAVALVMECGALLGGVDDHAVEMFRRLGEDLTCLVQLADDLRDIFGKGASSDLVQRKMTYPVACFLEKATAEQRSEFEALGGELPHSLPRVRRLFYDSGAVQSCAETMEELRVQIHRTVAAASSERPALCPLLAVVDGLAGTLYEPDEVLETEHLRHPRGEFHDHIRRAQAEFVARMEGFGAPPVPRLVPWHLPHFMYQPDQALFFYPDVDGLSGEVLRDHAAVLGLQREEVVGVLIDQLPFVVAHETFHAWRDEAARLSRDSWHEEYVANRLAVTYCQWFCQDVLAQTLRLAALAEDRGELTLAARQVLGSCHQASQKPLDYGLGQRDSMRLHLRMIQQLAGTRRDLTIELSEALCGAVCAA